MGAGVKNHEKFPTFLMDVHSMARANLNKSKKKLTSTTTATKYIPKRPRICINWNPSFQTSLHKIFKNYFSLSKSCSHLEVFLLSKWPLGYVLCCCGNRSQDFFNFIQIGSSHTVRRHLWATYAWLGKLYMYLHFSKDERPT